MCSSEHHARGARITNECSLRRKSVLYRYSSSIYIVFSPCEWPLPRLIFRPKTQEPTARGWARSSKRLNPRPGYLLFSTRRVCRSNAYVHNRHNRLPLSQSASSILIFRPLFRGSQGVSPKSPALSALHRICLPAQQRKE